MSLTALQIKNAKPGRYADGKGLYLLVKPTGTKSWILRVQADGRRRDFGLGPVDLVNLSEARAKALEGRKMVFNGLDPSKEWRRKVEVTPTFEAAARQFLEKIKGGWKNEKHAAQWIVSLERFAFPALGAKPIDKIDAPDIQAALLPIWLTVPETARRVRQRIAGVLDYAHGQGWRSTEAPMRAVAKGLPKQPKNGGHFAAMPYPELPAYMRELRKQACSVGRLALEFTILTAARSGETRGATWAEVDLEKKLWTVPAGRMKMGETHTVPLSDDAIDVLERAKALSAGKKGALIFPGTKGQPLSDMTMGKALKQTGGAGYTVHGFRSAFREWVAETLPQVPGAVAEAALAHAVSNKVEAAYRRTKFLDQRRELMATWAEFLGGAK